MLGLAPYYNERPTLSSEVRACSPFTNSMRKVRLTQHA